MIYVLSVITFVIHVCTLWAVFTSSDEKSNATIKFGATIICIPPIILALLVGFGG